MKNELLEVAKNFLKEELNLRTEIIKDLTFSIVNSPKFYIKIGSMWYMSLTTETAELYMFTRYTYTSIEGKSTVNYFIRDDEIIEPKKVIYPWENINVIFHEFIYHMNYDVIEKSGMNLKLIKEYVDIVRNFVGYCKINAGSYSDYINFKDYIYLALTIIDDFKNYGEKE